MTQLSPTRSGDSLRPVAVREEIRALTIEEFGHLRKNILVWQESG